MADQVSPAADPMNSQSGVGSEKKADEEQTPSLLRCLVYCRLRPKNKTDFKEGGFPLLSIDKNRIIVKDQRHYDFDGTFGESSSQEDIFETVAVPCISHAFNGFCAAIMCYGQTGTGKSFTMCNTAPGSEGILPRAARYIFDRIENDTSRKYEVIAQFVQIYRDHLGDLMVGTGRDRVDIHYDMDEGVSLTGCSSHVLHSAAEFMRFYNTGNERRVVTATAMNPESSRGHTALVLRIISEGNDIAEGKMKGKVTLIDLAGYERFSKTGITHDNPIMKDEAKCINASLLSLSYVVSALSGGGRHIPWRNSKLTRILQDSIGGRSRTSIILTVGPSSDHFHETTNTLQFGLRAMDVKVSAKQSVSVDYRKLAMKLQTLLDERDEQINVLELQIASRDAEREDLLQRYEQDRADLTRRFESDMAQLTAKGATPQQIQNLREVYNVEQENLAEQRDEAMRYQEEEGSKEIKKLIREQEHQEAKRRAEMKLAQERIIEDFQSKLDKAREGTNDDLVKALQQLAEKDSILASRANDTARLHEHIDVLMEQIRELGGTPVQEATFPETFLDVGQVEEIQRQLDAEVERQRCKVVELRAEVDRLSVMCSERVAEINQMRDENNQMRERLAATGVKMDPTDEVAAFLRERRAEMIDSVELETVRVMMQADVDELRARNAELEDELKRLRTDRASLPLTARVRGTARGPPPHCAVPGTARGRLFYLPPESDAAGGSFGGTVRHSTAASAEGRSFRQLSDQLTFSAKEKAALQERIITLEAAMASKGMEAPKPYIPPIKLALPPLAPVTNAPPANAAGAPMLGITASDATQSSVALATGDAGSAPPVHSDMDVLLRVKDDEIDALLDTIERQEYQLSAARSSEEFHQRVISELRQELLTAQLAAPEPTNVPHPLESIAMDEYMSILRAMRDSERRLALRLVERDTDDDPVEVETLLEEKDRELQLKEELIVERASKVQYVAKLCIRLKTQMESLGIEPCCQLPESFRELIEREQWELEDQVVGQRELEEELRHANEDKARTERLLQTLSEDRERQAAVISSVQARFKEVEQREQKVSEALSRVTREKSQKEEVLEETLRRATRELMDTQARLSRAEEAEKIGFIGRLLKRLK